MTKTEIRERAITAGVDPGQCPVCGADRVVSNRIPVAKCPQMSPNAISFDCPNDTKHIDALDLDVYIVRRKGHAALDF
jgi:hypothetical protein